MWWEVSLLNDGLVGVYIGCEGEVRCGAEWSVRCNVERMCEVVVRVRCGDEGIMLRGRCHVSEQERVSSSCSLGNN